MRPSTTHYALGTHPVTGTGFGISEEQLTTALAGAVADIVYDDTGTDEVAALLDGLSDTNFTRVNLDAILTGSRPPEDWRVGEALAESYLVECKNCYFPWPDGRDERKPGSCLPGADLVGLHKEGETHRFAFGEVKTSGVATYPPGVVYGRHGLKQQLEDLRDCDNIRNRLVLYLGYRAVRADWKDRYRDACASYLRDTCNVRIFGLLIRDVAPNSDDLSARVNSLAQGCPAQMCIDLVAIYLPSGSIATLATRVAATRQSGGAA